MFNIVFTFFYIALGFTILLSEYRRIKKRNFDLFTLFILLYLLYIIVPAAVIHGILGFNPNQRTGIFFFDSVFNKLNSLDSLIVLILNILLIFGFFIVKNVFYYNNKYTNSLLFIKIRPLAIKFWIFFGFFICFLFFYSLGDNFSDAYSNLIRFRNLDPSIERNAFSANAFSITLTFSWLTAALCFCQYQNGSKGQYLLFFILSLFFSFLMGSRRAYIFLLLIFYFGIILKTNKFYINRVLLILPFAFILIGFGKEFNASFSDERDISHLTENYESIGALFLRIFSDIGISQVESYATIQNFGFMPRFGIDIILSVLRRIPDGMLGLDIDWPERIVRISTALFTSPEDADIPPGLLGASWIDFPFLGAFFWGLFLGIQFYFANYFYKIIKLNNEKIAFFILVGLILTLPLNSGSYDYVFSIDILLLIFILSTVFKISKNEIY